MEPATSVERKAIWLGSALLEVEEVITSAGTADRYLRSSNFLHLPRSPIVGTNVLPLFFSIDSCISFPLSREGGPGTDTIIYQKKLGKNISPNDRASG